MLSTTLAVLAPLPVLAGPAPAGQTGQAQPAASPSQWTPDWNHPGRGSIPTQTPAWHPLQPSTPTPPPSWAPLGNSGSAPPAWNPSRGEGARPVWVTPPNPML